MTARILNFVGPTNEFELEARRCDYRRVAGLDVAHPLVGGADDLVQVVQRDLDSHAPQFP